MSTDDSLFDQTASGSFLHRPITALQRPVAVVLADDGTTFDELYLDSDARGEGMFLLSLVYPTCLNPYSALETCNTPFTCLFSSIAFLRI